METQKIVNLLNGADNENSKFATKKWYIIESESNGNCSQNDEIKFLTGSIESSLCDYSNAYVLVTGNITATPNNAAMQVAFKNCAPFEKCRTEINETFIDETDFINIAMPMYNLIEYSDNYSDTSGSLWQFKRDEITNNADVTNDDNASSFKYKASIIGDTRDNGTKNEVKIAVPLKYLSNFWRSLEMRLINCKVELSLKWYERCLLAVATTSTFTITDTKLYVPIVTLSIEDNSKLSKLLNEGFKRSIYWNEYKVTPNKIVEIAAVNDKKYIKELLDSSCQGVNRFFVYAYDNTVGDNYVSVDSYKIYFLSRVKIDNCNIEIDGRNIYDQPINDSIKQYDEIRKITTGKGDDYTTGCLLVFAYFEKNYRLIAADLIISNEKMNDIMKITQALEDSNILLKGVTKTIENETKEQKGGFLSMLLGTLGASLLGNLLTGKGIVRVGSGNNKGKGIVRAGYGRPLSPALQKQLDF